MVSFDFSFLRTCYLLKREYIVRLFSWFVSRKSSLTPDEILRSLVEYIASNDGLCGAGFADHVLAYYPLALEYVTFIQWAETHSAESRVLRRKQDRVCLMPTEKQTYFLTRALGCNPLDGYLDKDAASSLIWQIKRERDEHVRHSILNIEAFCKNLDDASERAR
jgi:hypothetical protein